MTKGQRRLVVWGTVMFALVLHLSFCRWRTGDRDWSHHKIAGPDALYLYAAPWVARIEYSKDKYRPEGNPMWAYLFGIFVPLTLVGGAGFVWLGGRKA